MNEASAAALTQHYGSLQRCWKVVERSADYSRLVVPNGNNSEPVHRWFHLKEAFSSQLLSRAIKDAGLVKAEGLSILDPFVGSGTTLVSAADLGDDYGSVRVVGVERNPFLFLLARAKAGARLCGHTLVKSLRHQFAAVSSAYAKGVTLDMPVPPSTTLTNEKYFPSEHLESLLRIRAAIESEASGLSSGVLLSCLAAAVEPSSRLRRDGRALRFEPSRQPRDPWQLFVSRVHIVIEDLEKIEPSQVSAKVKFGDGRYPQRSVEKGDLFSLIIFSPPYPNNIDYTEVYKAEAWILGCYQTIEDLRKQRLSTVRSHPSIKFEERYQYSELQVRSKIAEILDPVVAAVPVGDRYESGRKKLVRGYGDDMLQVLRNCRALALKDARLVFVVGNSVHGSNEKSFIIAADVIMGALAELAGWEVEEVRVARYLKRRGTSSSLLRESVVSLRPA